MHFLWPIGKIERNVDSHACKIAVTATATCYEHPKFRTICRRNPAQHASCFGVLPHFASARVLFVSDDQALAAGIPAAHDRVIQISLQRATTQERFLVDNLN